MYNGFSTLSWQIYLKIAKKKLKNISQRKTTKNFNQNILLKNIIE